MKAQFGIGDIFSETFRIALRNWLPMLLYGLVVTAVGTGVELTVGERAGTLADSLVSFILGYGLFVVFWKRENLPFAGWSALTVVVYLVASLLGGVAIGIGFLLLIVPGLLLMARWSLMPSFIVGRGMGMGEAFSESWAATREKQWTLVGFYAVLIVAVVIVLGGLGATLGIIELADRSGGDVLATGSVANFIVETLGNAATALGYATSVALYLLLVEHGGDEESIFG